MATTAFAAVLLACSSSSSGSSGGSAGADACSAASGTAALAAPCTTDADCAPSADGAVFCVRSFLTGSADHQTCLLELRGKENDQPCNLTTDGVGILNTFTTSAKANPAGPLAYFCDVNDGVFCDAHTLVCRKALPVGAGCDSAFEGGCTRDAYCTDDNRCVPRLPLGASCVHAYTAAGDGCIAGAHCTPVEAVTATCTARVASASSCDGGSCDSPSVACKTPRP